MTYEELRQEIEHGPLADVLRHHWHDVFADGPEPPCVEKPSGDYDPGAPAWTAWQAHERWARLQARQGKLKTDAAFAIHALLRERSKELGWGDWDWKEVSRAREELRRKARAKT